MMRDWLIFQSNEFPKEIAAKRIFHWSYLNLKNVIPAVQKIDFLCYENMNFLKKVYRKTDTSRSPGLPMTMHSAKGV